ncbi:SGNH/GDSL hydrolase family protein [Allosediminivita pacifica]|uniref:PrsD/PrsE exporter outer membrane protein n=1 Tax=Allosediminivita pacifica TaxID=1267769 RepID=A0A2T6AFZ4_9RHOB|nr:SGNH/GDSL hydrolase family protein [Allosediminivita pacifica]PTX42758.1 PrsD/PrsE exporter outer membrane protein [Allosediminivita pacifica]GGB06716.1 hypothetical protein GCM10011324_16030 [Allosediminivita pacifica]
MRRAGGLALAALVATGLALWTAAQMTSSPAPQDGILTTALPADSPLSLAVLGTSLSHGESWPELLAERLSTCLDHQVTVDVIARPGAASDWGLTQAGTLADLSPDIALVEFAINDADILDGLSLRAAYRNDAEIISRIRDQSPDTRIFLMTTSPAHGLRGLARPRLGAHYRQYRDLAEELDLGLADLYPRWLALPRAERGMAGGGLHPDPETAAALIVPPLADLLAQTAGHPGCAPV